MSDFLTEGWVGLLIALFAGPFLYDLVKENSQAISRWIVDFTANLQPRDVREERRMEWRAHVHDVSGDASRLKEALGFALRYLIPFSRFRDAFSRVLRAAKGVTTFKSGWIWGGLAGLAAIGLVGAIETFYDVVKRLHATELGAALLPTVVVAAFGYFVVKVWRRQQERPVVRPENPIEKERNE